jgi:hypothetical protein
MIKRLVGNRFFIVCDGCSVNDLTFFNNQAVLTDCSKPNKFIFALCLTRLRKGLIRLFTDNSITIVKKFTIFIKIDAFL